MMMHPSDRRVLRFAEGSAPKSDRRRMTNHLASCERCRAAVTATRNLREALHTLPAEAADDLLTQVLASRAAGARAVLPLTPPALRRGRHPRVIIGVGIAAVATLMVAPSALRFLAGSRSATPDPRAVPIIESFPAAGPLMPARLRPMDLWYDETRMDAKSSVTYRRHFRIERIAGDDGGWRILSDGGTHEVALRDTVVLDARTLEPTSWIASSRFEKGTRRVEYTLRGSVVQLHGASSGTVRTGDPRYEGTHDTTFTIRSNLPGPRYINQANLIALMMAIPVRGSWSGRFAAISPTGLGPHLVPTDFHLIEVNPTEYTLQEVSGGFDHRMVFRRSDGLMIRQVWQNEAGSWRVESTLVSAK